MKVLIISHAAGSPKYGPNMRWYYLARRFKELGCDVTIAGSSYFHKYIRKPRVSGLVSSEYIDGIRYIFIRNITYKGVLGRVANQILFPLMVRIFYKKFMGVNKPDAIVVSSPPPFGVFSARYISKKAKALLVYEVRDLWPMIIQELGDLSSRHPYIKILEMTERYAVKKSDLVVSVKPGDYEYFKERYRLKKEKFEYIPNGFIPIDNVQGGSRSKLRRCEEHKFTIGYVGAMSAYYGLRELVEAAGILKEYGDIRFVLVGSGEDIDSLKEIKNQRSLDNVVFVGNVAKEDVPVYLETFDVCYVGLKDVQANQYGISCNKIFEYMYAGKPIIASYNTRYDPVQYAQCGITVSPGSPESIVSAILELKKSSCKRKLLGENARAYFDEYHDFSAIGERYFYKVKELIKDD